jgi:hypothetical protein
MHVPHRHLEIFVPRQFLDRRDRRAPHCKMRTEGVTENVRARIPKIHAASRAQNKGPYPLLREHRPVVLIEHAASYDVAVLL